MRRPPRPRARPRTERGATTLLVAAGLALAVALAAGVGRVGAAAERRARTDAVADLVALAAVTGGPDGAAAVARANGARLRSTSVVGDVTVVRVQVRGTIAGAAARPAAG